MSLVARWVPVLRGRTVQMKPIGGGVKGYEIRYLFPDSWPPVHIVLPGEPHGLRNPLALWTYLDGVRTFVKGACASLSPSL